MSEPMHRECALFYKDNYVIVASSNIVSDENLPSYEQLVTNNESIHYSVVESYTIYLVDMKRACLCDKIRFGADKINLTHNQSLSLFRNVFAVLSQQNQTIYVYNLVESSGSGTCKFMPVRQIGRFCFSDDAEFVTSSLNTAAAAMDSTRPILTHHHRPPRFQLIQGDSSSNNGEGEQLQRPSTRMTSSRFGRQQQPLQLQPQQQLLHQPQLGSTRLTASYSYQSTTKPFAENCLTGMKQRIVTYFFREALRNNNLSQFYLCLDNILKLKMYKMQLLDDRLRLSCFSHFYQFVEN